MKDQKLSKADIARINGAKSRGPTSPEGKARSSRNAVKHGLSAKRFMIMPAEQEEYDEHLTAAIAHWAPQSDYELYLVTKLARADFQHDRADAIQNSLVDLEIDIIAPEIERAFESIDANGAVALGYKSLNDNSTAHRNMDRHLARLARERIQARKTLLEAITYRRNLEAEEAKEAGIAEPAPVAMQNEPIAPVAPSSVTPIDTVRRPVPPPSTEPTFPRWEDFAQAEQDAMQKEPTGPADDTPEFA